VPNAENAVTRRYFRRPWTFGVNRDDPALKLKEIAANKGDRKQENLALVRFAMLAL
jgi:hypothetical protein